MVSVLRVLTQPNVGVSAEAVTHGSNSIVTTSIAVENWQPWPDFDYGTLTRIFRRELDEEYRGEPEPRPLNNDLRICNEETLEDVLRRFISPIVNYALNWQLGSPHYGRGSRCGPGYRPDWSVISASCLDEYGRYANVLPGDTKLDAKWWSGMVDEEDNFGEWQKVVSQIVTYMASHNTRYGFIITDACVVALRITRRPIGVGLAAGRPRREAAAGAASGHQRHISDITMTSGASSYHDDDPLQWEYHNPEYINIPWGAHGRGRLTIKLALWCLAMMATNGDSYIDYSYPDLDSWRSGERGYIHNTSGARKAALSGIDHYLEPGQAAEESAGPSNALRHEGADTYDNILSWAGHNPVPLSPANQSEDVPQLSQAGNAFGGPVDEEGEAYEEKGRGRGDDDDHTEVGAPPKRINVRVEKRTITRKVYFVDAKGNEKETGKAEWRKVAGGYEFQGRKHVYFTKKLP
ncbi:hypothetical protein MKZ38_003604 [Zalerion maritima]|uniref:Uncharacterized protein n=1 Tax=Zalerion maritima TaxID=339359 RepID=A0AAD5RN90_9PEZI|nr:hypothetical protein MKZ38_003604 [Zalerion maritima]